MTEGQPVETPFAPESLADRYQVAYQEARHSLDAQEASLDELRARAGTLVAAAAIVTSFLVGPVLTHNPIGAAGVAGFVGFAICVGASLWILLPGRKWRFHVRPSLIIVGYIERDLGPASLGEMYRGLADEYDDCLTENTEPLELRFWAFAVAIGALGAEAALLVVELWLHH